MGWGKKIRKSVKKAVKKVTKPIEKVVKEAGKVVGGVAGALAGGGMAQVIEPPAPVDTAAQVIEPPSKDDVDINDDSQTESGKKKARAGGKKSLSVARSSGGGLNI
ncbi:tail assembly protein [Enterobacter phage vB_SEqdws-315]|uniref:Tail assembly protein n=1 Tax=Enterobacter phage vB_SEqdws-315 TaxID=2894396 RepID=A0AAE8YF86_9CAUD|nr:tail assembly protein [Enterobacter phage vB_SEqdws-315]